MKPTQEIKTFESISRGEKVPRKFKLAFIGRKISKKDLKAKIKRWLLKDEQRQSRSYFCPNCGCGTGYLYDHNVEYPERWIEEFCLRCHSRIAITDNSPWYYELDKFKED